jgi:hypothetical protein
VKEMGNSLCVNVEPLELSSVHGQYHINNLFFIKI